MIAAIGNDLRYSTIRGTGLRRVLWNNGDRFGLDDAEPQLAQKLEKLAQAPGQMDAAAAAMRTSVTRADPPDSAPKDRLKDPSARVLAAASI